MTNKFRLKQTEKLLKDYNAYKSSLIYLKRLAENDAIQLRKVRTIQARIEYIENTVSALERALTLLPATEHDVITRMYINKEHTFDDVCAGCALEKSSVYRHRAKAIKKLAKAIYGTDA